MIYDDIYESMEFIESDLNDFYFIERFLGKTKYLQAAEAVLEDIKRDLKDEPTMDVIHSENNKKLCALLEKQFGFRRVYISWDRGGESRVNGYTLCSADVIFRGSKFIENFEHSGFYDKGHDHICYIAISSQMFYSLDMTAAEVLAIILHEIGHNFDRSPYMVIKMLYHYIRSFFIITQKDGFEVEITPNIVGGALTAGMTTNPGKSIITSIDSWVENIKNSFPVFKKLSYHFNKAIDFINRGLSLIISPVVLASMPIYILLSPIFQTMTVFTRKTEQLADSFATMYGYGPELGSALNRLTTTNLKVEKAHGGLYKLMASISMANREIINFVLSGHGTTAARIESNLEYLRREIKVNEFPREVREELLKDIEDMERIKDIYVQAQYNGNDYAFAGFVRETIDDVFSGRSDYIGKLLFGDKFVK